MPPDPSAFSFHSTALGNPLLFKHDCLTRSGEVEQSNPSWTLNRYMGYLCVCAWGGGGCKTVVFGGKQTPVATIQSRIIVLRAGNAASSVLPFLA